MNDNILSELERDIEKFNAYTIFNKYYDIFKKNLNKLPSRKIILGKEYYRARAGNRNEKGAIDDCDIEMKIPYFREEIGAAPIFNTPGGRFNREGNSFLYLASDVETCVSEMKLEKGQICSIGKFQCVCESEYFDLTYKSEDKFFIKVKRIMLQPIHGEIKYKYLVTQFLADIIREIGFSGIIYESTQGQGENLVCFNKEAYKFVDYSDEMYEIKQITYDVSKVEDGYKKYARFDRELNSFNENEEDKKQETFNYIQEKIYREQKQEIREILKKAEAVNEDEKMSLYNAIVDDFKYSIYYRDVFNARGDFWAKRRLCEEAIRDYYQAITWGTCKALIDRDIDKIIDKIYVRLTENKLLDKNITKTNVKNIIDSFRNNIDGSIEKWMGSLGKKFK